MKMHYLAAGFTAVLAAAAPAQAASTDLEGNWDVQTQANGGLSQIDITFDGRNWQVRAAGVCSPRACEYGTAAGTALVPPGRRDARRDMTGITASFTDREATRQVIATAAGRNRLQVTTIQTWRDGRPATVTTENFQRADRQAETLAQCTDIGSSLRIRNERGTWVLAGNEGEVGRFDSVDQAGYARFVIAALGLRQKCEIAEAGFEYWTVANGAFPSGVQAGEQCFNLNPRQISVQRSGRNWAVRAGNSVLYTAQDRAVADTIAQTLIDNRATAQCTIGQPGRGMTYFRR